MTALGVFVHFCLDYFITADEFKWEFKHFIIVAAQFGAKCDYTQLNVN